MAFSTGATMSEYILTESQDGVSIIRFNREDKKNALTLAMYDALTAALEEAARDPKVRVVLFTGSETCFTSGNDLVDFVNNPPTGEDSPVFRFLQALISFPKPVITAVCGAAVGIGTTMLLHSDINFAGDNAKFKLPFANLGLCPEAGSSLLMPLMMGHHRASELLLLGKTFDAQTAKEVGFLNGIHAPQEVFSVALETAKQLTAQPAAALRLTKSLLKQHQQDLLQQVLRTEATHFIERLASPEAAEPFSAFAEKRKPDFSSFD